MRAGVLSLVVVASTHTALAAPPADDGPWGPAAPARAPHPPPPPPDEAPASVDWRATPAWLEWSTFVHLGAGSAAWTPNVVARPGVGAPPAGPVERTLAVEASVGAEATVAVGRGLRVGPYLELGGAETTVGAELVVTRAPANLDLFHYRGQGAATLRVGAGAERVSAAATWGYRAPWRLWGPHDRTTRYLIGARVVAAVSVARDDARDWSATVGLELEPAGALRYLLAVSSWY